jgi:SAM-dependent methyltransferase
LHGCDRNAAAIAWCRDHVDAEVAVNELAPPLHYPDGMFGLVWSISVFTHLPKPLQEPWALELRRVLRPDGVLLVTTHGPSLRGKLTRRERERFERGELVVRAPRAAGSYCNTFHPPDYLEKLFAVAGLRLFSYEDRVMHGQALAVFRPN